jgi:phosphoribosylformimino-5-aminoimidazole carboxamide ribotide isomerase
MAVDLGARRIIVLDLARVGGGAGTGTEELCSRMASTFPKVTVIAGGGVAGRADLLRLKAAGVAAVLVASALHDGRITKTDLAEL